MSLRGRSRRRAAGNWAEYYERIELVWYGLVEVRFGMVQFGLVKLSLVWLGLVQVGLLWPSLAWFGLVFLSLYVDKRKK